MFASASELIRAPKDKDWYESAAINSGSLYKTKVQIEEVENGES